MLDMDASPERATLCPRFYEERAAYDHAPTGALWSTVDNLLFPLNLIHPNLRLRANGSGKCVQPARPYRPVSNRPVRDRQSRMSAVHAVHDTIRPVRNVKSSAASTV